jgi:hypothetical protein
MHVQRGAATHYLALGYVLNSQISIEQLKPESAEVQRDIIPAISDAARKLE